MAEGVRFELTAPVRESLVFKTSSLNRSDISPNQRCERNEHVCNIYMIPYNRTIVKRFCKIYIIKICVVNRYDPKRPEKIKDMVLQRICAAGVEP